MSKCMYHLYLEDACQSEGIYAYPPDYRIAHLCAYVWCEKHKKDGNVLIDPPLTRKALRLLEKYLPIKRGF